MKRSDFHFDLPPELIAQVPLAERTASRLLCMNRNTGAVKDKHFAELCEFLNPGDLLVFNNTRVIPARLFGKKETGGQLEILFERLQDEYHALAQIRASKSPKPGSLIILEDGSQLKVTGRQNAFFELESEQALLPVIERLGHMPLPPYIERSDNKEDQTRYQTVYAEKPGAVAAPTAGLHFDQALLDKLVAKGVNSTYVTLHVGAGTFQPMRVDNIEDHTMHAEYLEVSQETCDAIQQTRAKGGRVIAVGTTAVRSLETAALSGELKPFTGDSRIFIYPGYEFKAIDGMITNFHLPESTLIMLVCAFAGYDNTMNAYKHAVENQYRFFSYGDAMLLS